MGNEPLSHQKSRFMKEVSKRLTFVKEINDQRFGDVQVFRRKDGDELVMVKGKWANDPEEYRINIREIKRRKDLDHKNLLKLLGFTEATDEFFCGDVNKITLYYEYYFHDLSKELERRRTLNVPYEESDIWYIAESVASAGEFLQQNDIPHGDINPSQILLTTKGFVKIGDHNLINNKATGYQKTIEGSFFSYLSPHQMKSMRNGESKPGDNPFKADAYAYGMTLLEIASSRSSQLCYDWDKKCLKYDIINERLRIIQQRYSDFLTNFITSLLQDDEQRRLSFKEINYYLNPYQEKIRDMIPFVFQGTFPEVGNIRNDANLASPTQKSQILNDRMKNSRGMIVTFNPYGQQQVTPPRNNSNMKWSSPERNENYLKTTPSSPRISPGGLNFNMGSPGREPNSSGKSVNRIIRPASPVRASPEPLNYISNGLGAPTTPIVFQQNSIPVNTRFIRMSPSKVSPSASAMRSERVNGPIQIVSQSNQVRFPSPTSRNRPNSPARINKVEGFQNPEVLNILPKPTTHAVFDTRELKTNLGTFHGPGMVLPSPTNLSLSSADRATFFPDPLNMNNAPRASARLIPNTSYSTVFTSANQINQNFTNQQIFQPSLIGPRAENQDSFSNTRFSGDTSNYRDEIKHLENTLTDLDKRVSAALENSKFTIQRHDDFRT